MNEHVRSSPVKQLLFNNALITPSASPPGSRSFFSSPIRECVPPPAKKRRFASTASSSSFSASTPFSSSSSRLDPSSDLHDARRASSLRVLDVWSSLAARYNRRLDEDDIIDLRTGDVVKDRGVIREFPQQFEIGHFADADDPLNLNDASSEGGGTLTEVEDDVDEIDAFAPESDISKELRLETRVVPPVQVMNPADADDLREFMEAERLRRELDGEDESSEDDFEPPVDSEFDAPPALSETRTHESEGVFNQQQYSGVELVDDDSEDEFAAWGVDEGNTIYQVVSEPEPYKSPSPSPSQASILLPSSPIIAKSPLRTNLVHTPPVPEDAQRGLEHRPETAYPQAQLHTPPPSASPVIDASLDDIDILFPPPQLHSRSKPVKQRNHRQVSPEVGSRLESSPKACKSKRTSKRKSKLVPEVVIPRRPVRVSQTSAGDEATSSNERSTGTKDKNDAHILDPQLLPEFEEGSSTFHNRGHPQKSRKKSSMPGTCVPKDCARRDSPPIRIHKRKRSTSRNSAQDLHVDAQEKSSQSEKHVGNVTQNDSTDESDTGKRSRSKSRARSALRKHSVPNSYPYSIPYTSQHQHPVSYPPTFQPIQDPNAQLIIAQAMHQLAYLVTGPQPPVNGWSSIPVQQMPGSGYPSFASPYHPQQWPFTPTHHQHSDMDPLAIGGHSSSNYDTPTHHPHRHPYMFTPSLSRNTLPPSSPDEPSPPTKRRGRSKSRGRKVSFKDLSTSPTRMANPRGKNSNKQEPSPAQNGKCKDRAAESSEEENEISEEDVVSSPLREKHGRKAVDRGRTPGPSPARDRKGRE